MWFLSAVGEAPSFPLSLEDVEADLDTTISLEVQVKGHPRPEVTWFKDGDEIQPSDRIG